MPHTFLSVLIDDCIAKGKDYNAGGARYNNTFVQAVGIGTVSDSLSALKDVVFERGELTLPRFIQVLDDDFQGMEVLRQRLLNKTHKYGNDDDYVDDEMVRTFRMLFAAIDGRPNTKGGAYRLEMLPTTCHVYFGEVCAASADGRRQGIPLSEGISPVQGADRRGPTAVLKSAGKMDHVKTGGTLLNMKFTPGLLAGEDGIDHLHSLVRSYFKLDGHHLQFNVVNAAKLREAQAKPEEHHFDGDERR
jgi:formate C-acetyltransferase